MFYQQTLRLQISFAKGLLHRTYGPLLKSKELLPPLKCSGTITSPRDTPFNTPMRLGWDAEISGFSEAEMDEVLTISYGSYNRTSNEKGKIKKVLVDRMRKNDPFAGYMTAQGQSVIISTEARFKEVELRIAKHRVAKEERKRKRSEEKKKIKYVTQFVLFISHKYYKPYIYIYI